MVPNKRDPNDWAHLSKFTLLEIIASSADAVADMRRAIKDAEAHMQAVRELVYISTYGKDYYGDKSSKREARKQLALKMRVSKAYKADEDAFIRYKAQEN